MRKKQITTYLRQLRARRFDCVVTLLHRQLREVLNLLLVLGLGALERGSLLGSGFVFGGSGFGFGLGGRC
jgi:hypothetical protein